MPPLLAIVLYMIVNKHFSFQRQQMSCHDLQVFPHADRNLDALCDGNFPLTLATQWGDPTQEFQFCSCQQSFRTCSECQGRCDSNKEYSFSSPKLRENVCVDLQEKGLWIFGESESKRRVIKIEKRDGSYGFTLQASAYLPLIPDKNNTKIMYLG